VPFGEPFGVQCGVPFGEPFVAFDVETTGLLPGVDRIVELAAVAFQGEAVLASYQQLVDPGMPMPREASQVNGIQDDMLRGCPSVQEALPEFLRVMSQGTPIAHNAPFDVAFVAREIERTGCRFPSGLVLDTRRLARRAFPGRFAYGLQALAGDLRLPTCGAHRALADAHTCRLLFRASVRELARRQCGPAEAIETAAFLATLSGPALSFGPQALAPGRHAEAIQEAIGARQTVEIDYLNACGASTTRRIYPLSFQRLGGSMAVHAFCFLRNDRRTFRLDGIQSVRP